MNNQEGKLISAEVIRDNFKVFKDVYEHLTRDEKYDLLHLLIRRIVYHEDRKEIEKGKKMWKIKMDLWELPPIDPSEIKSAKPVNDGFAERHAWLLENRCDSTRECLRHHPSRYKLLYLQSKCL